MWLFISAASRIGEGKIIGFSYIDLMGFPSQVGKIWEVVTSVYSLLGSTCKSWVLKVQCTFSKTCTSACSFSLNLPIKFSHFFSGQLIVCLVLFVSGFQHCCFFLVEQYSTLCKLAMASTLAIDSSWIRDNLQLKVFEMLYFPLPNDESHCWKRCCRSNP